MTSTKKRQSGQGMVEYALILALVALIVIVALIATGGQVPVLRHRHDDVQQPRRLLSDPGLGDQIARADR